MPSKKKKYNARFPAVSERCASSPVLGRIKKIMQTDEEIGKVAQAVPIIISRTLELFVHSLLTKTMQITNAKNAKTLSPSHMKQCILSESRFDFLKDLVKSLPDVSGPDDEVPTPPLTPAPTLQINLPNTTATQHSDLERQKLLGLPVVISANHKSTRDNGSTEHMNSVNKEATTVVSQVPQFQISVPASYQISQPNFYMELNPSNLSENTSASSRPASNYSHTANIDEDYDT